MLTRVWPNDWLSSFQSTDFGEATGFTSRDMKRKKDLQMSRSFSLISGPVRPTIWLSTRQIGSVKDENGSNEKRPKKVGTENNEANEDVAGSTRPDPSVANKSYLRHLPLCVATAMKFLIPDHHRE
ncbi:hypothetical protein R1flu_009800 [Riccia fluitans]|uniref:Uncharacterized protein n=1 Tax=Riccia fluitans TaxID=41844 RepID=A0ABD1Z3Z7_9MARC